MIAINIGIKKYELPLIPIGLYKKCIKVTDVHKPAKAEKIRFEPKILADIYIEVATREKLSRKNRFKPRKGFFDGKPRIALAMIGPRSPDMNA